MPLIDDLGHLDLSTEAKSPKFFDTVFFDVGFNPNLHGVPHRPRLATLFGLNAQNCATAQPSRTNTVETSMHLNLATLATLTADDCPLSSD
jgi:hypothetical protein